VTDKDLIKKYDEVYRDGEEKFWTFLPIEERLAVLQAVDWSGKTVLEVGCGTGDLAATIASFGALQVTAIDSAAEAISRAKIKYDLSNLEFWACDYGRWPAELMDIRYDVVVAVGVIEHTEDPLKMLENIMEWSLNAYNGVALITCPCFLNPRGLVWMTLQILFDAPMSLTDKHFIDARDIEKWCELHRYKFSQKALDASWGCGPRWVQDFKQRLPKVFPDMSLTRIAQFIAWIDRYQAVIKHESSGANRIYKIGR
jgi:SAM-dependent methyltransferase